MNLPRQLSERLTETRRRSRRILGLDPPRAPNDNMQTPMTSNQPNQPTTPASQQQPQVHFQQQDPPSVHEPSTNTSSTTSALETSQYDLPSPASTPSVDLSNQDVSRLSDRINKLAASLESIIRPTMDDIKNNEHLRTPSQHSHQLSSQSSSNQYPNDINSPTLDPPMLIATLDHQSRVSSPNHSVYQQRGRDPPADPPGDDSFLHETATTPVIQSISSTDPPEDDKQQYPPITITAQAAIPVEPLQRKMSAVSGITMPPHAIAVTAARDGFTSAYAAPASKPPPPAAPTTKTSAPFFPPAAPWTSSSPTVPSPAPAETPTVAPPTSTPTIRAPPPVAPPSTTPPIVYVSSKDGLSLPSMGSKQYLAWKKLCILKVASSNQYGAMVTTICGETMFNPSMSDQHKKVLYLATINALGSAQESLFMSDELTECDGLKVWATLDAIHMDTKTPLLTRQTMLNNFLAMTKHRNESLQSYTTRFNQKLEEMKMKSVTIPSKESIVLKYISSLGLNWILKDIIHSFELSTWWKLMTMTEVMVHIKKEVDNYHAIARGTDMPTFHHVITGTLQPGNNNNNNNRNAGNGNSNGSNNTTTPNIGNRNNLSNRNNQAPPPAPAPSPVPPSSYVYNPPATTPAPAPPARQSPAPAPAPPRTRAPISSGFLTELESDLRRPNANHDSIFTYLHNQFSNCCPIHNGAPTHGVLDCRHLWTKCRELRCLPAFYEVKRRHGYLPPLTEPLQQQYRRPTATAPSPTPTPVPAPTPPPRYTPAPAPTPPPVQNPYAPRRQTTQPAPPPVQNPYVPRQQNPAPTPPPVRNPYAPRQQHPAPAPPSAMARRVVTEEQPQYTNAYEELAQYYEEVAETNEQTVEQQPVEEQVQTDNSPSNNNVMSYSESPPVCNHIQISHSTITKTPQHVMASTSKSIQEITFTNLLKTIYRIILDSGATDTMCPFQELFEKIHYFETDELPVAIMGDDSTSVPILGHGYINVSIHGKRIRTHALYVPSMGNACLFSIKQHIRSQGCTFIAESGNTTLTFPNFLLFPRIDTEIDVLCQSATSSTATIDFNEETSVKTDIHQKSASTDKSSTTLKLIPQSMTPYIPTTEYHKFHSTVQIKKIIPQASIPTKGTEGSIGYDVASVATVHIQPGERQLIPTGLAVAMKDDMYLRIAERSSLALKGLAVKGGVVDSDYRGEIKIILRNDTNEEYVVQPGQQVAQFIFEKAASPCIEIVNSLPSTTRNKGGFGSTNTHPTTKRITTFRLNANDLLIIDNRNARPRIRRVHAPIQELLAPTTEQDIAGEKSTFTHHPMNDTEKAPLDIVLQMNINEPINPPQHNISESTSTTEVEPPPASDRVHSAQPKEVTMSKDVLRRSIGFLSTEPLLKHLDVISDKTLKVQKFSDNPTLDPGMAASIKARRRNKIPSEIPKHYSDVWHLDIGYGPCTAIGGVKYALMAVDKSTRYKFTYGLKNLTSSLHEAIGQFLIDCGQTPKLIRTDFDPKLFGGETKKIFTAAKVKVEAAPPYRQHQNGLVERAWQTVVSMTRNWLTSAQLPAKYWYFGIKRACEVLNMMPIKRFDKITTPFESVHGKKPDLRNLFPMFATAYIKHPTEGGEGAKWKNKALKTILVGQCPHSDAQLFYHPPTKQLLSCADQYRLDTSSPSGPQFAENYDNTFVFNTKSSLERIHEPLTHETNDTKYYKDPDTETYTEVTIISSPADDANDKYIVQQKVSGDIHEALASELHDSNPTIQPTDIPNQQLPFPHIKWLKQDAHVTLYLPTIMPRSKQGILHFEDGEWTFQPGRRHPNNHKAIELPNFSTIAESMINNKKLFRGWRTDHFVKTARRVRLTSNLIAHQIIARKVSAKNLHLLEAPSLLKHHQLHPDDKKIWDESYREEYQGLADIDTWETITEEEYQQTKHLYKGTMPTMAIAVIKFDKDGNPDRAKYRIVALGNLDPNSWSKSDCFAPVLSQFELRLLVAIAAQKNCTPKSGDVCQAFCQSYLPEGENYICRPPAGCPLTPKDIYWKLKKTLYGLKRSPRHFYELAKKILLSIGFTMHPSSPCIFVGTLIPGEAPVYLGLYVDDFIYFSESKAAEQKFEQLFGNKINTDFNGPIQWFLGIKFQMSRNEQNQLTILLTQEAYIETISNIADLDQLHVNTPKTPHRIGYPVDSIPLNHLQNMSEQAKLRHKMQQIIGCLTWVAGSTRPDIATITNLLAKYTANPAPGHLDAARRVVKYLKGTKEYGIAFTNQQHPELEAYLKFPLPQDKVTSLTDANWGPQDQSKPRPNETRTLPLFKTRSLSGFVIWLGGPIHWISKRQTITARSSAESEIYATDECTKCLLHLSFLLEGLRLQNMFMPKPIDVYNDNSACGQWSKNMTTKGLRHLQIRENAVRESVQNQFIKIKHIEGKINFADIFTKEDKDAEHYIMNRDCLLTTQRQVISRLPHQDPHL